MLREKSFTCKKIKVLPVRTVMDWIVWKLNLGCIGHSSCFTEFILACLFAAVETIMEAVEAGNGYSIIKFFNYIWQFKQMVATLL